MFEIGRLCVKLAGRDAGCRCVVIDSLNKNYVMIDGETRRRKCNIAHLEPLNNVIKINKGASHETVKKEFEKLGLKVRETKPKAKTERPKRIRKKKVKVEETTKEEKSLKKEEKKKEKKIGEGIKKEEEKRPIKSENKVKVGEKK